MKKAIIDIENLEVFPSLTSASRKIKCTPTGIFNAIVFNHKVKGRKFEYFEEWKLWENKTKEKHTRKNNIFFY